MNFVSDSEAAGRITPRKYRCVWMEAGILSYLLCDREFDCERCPLDEAMRSHYSPPGKAQGGSATRTDGEAVGRGATPRPGRTGTAPGHLAVTVMDDGILRIALEPTAAGYLPAVKSVVLPVPGRKITSGSPCCWFIFEGGTIPIRIPFSGLVERVNGTLAEHPHLAADAPADEGWLFDLRPAGSSGALRALLTAEDAESANFADVEVFRRLINECLRPPAPAVGHSEVRDMVTMQDGGRPVGELPAIIGPVKFLEIVRRAFWGKR